MFLSSLESDRLSTFHTRHRFLHYTEFHSLEEFRAATGWASRAGFPVVVLGNGSNTFFRQAEVKTLILKNALAPTLVEVSPGRVEASSSLPIGKILQYCFESSRESFYYLASVPATVGGALAMNAGRGREHGQTLYDFVERVSFFEDGEIRTAEASQIVKGHRETIFTGLHAKLILSAVFRFPQTTFARNPIQERIQWSQRVQDRTAPSCGSVFRKADPLLLWLLKGVRWREAAWSAKTTNWIVNRGASPVPIGVLIRSAQAMHRFFFRKCELELVVVD